MDILEQDAANDTTWKAAPPDPAHDHAHEGEMESFIATPRTDQTILEKMWTWWKAELKPGMHVIRKAGEERRYMFIVTSNSYTDRERETITSAALKAYEDSCYPGDGLFQCDNPLLWWHDDDVIMGEIVGVNYSEPFLIEVAHEAPTLMAKVLWDYAEQNGDNAGASHRFGYYKQDKQADGTYTRIYKQESTYLPERGLAANLGTYAGVIKDMASPQSDKRLNDIFGALGIPDAAAKIHAKSGELEKELDKLGISHKASKPPVPPMPPDAPPASAEQPAPGTPEDATEDTADTKAGGMTMEQYTVIMNNIGALVMDLVAAQEGMMDTQMSFAKSLKESEDARTASKTYTDSLEGQIKALTTRVDIAEKRLSLQPRTVTTSKGATAEEMTASVNAVKNTLETAERGDVQRHPIFDVEYDPKKTPKYD